MGICLLLGACHNGTTDEEPTDTGLARAQSTSTIAVAPLTDDATTLVLVPEGTTAFFDGHDQGYADGYSDGHRGIGEPPFGSDTWLNSSDPEERGYATGWFDGWEAGNALWQAQGIVSWFEACPDTMSAQIRNRGPTELSVHWIYLTFPDGTVWEDRVAWWDDRESILSVRAGSSGDWHLAAENADRDEFAAGEYRLLISAERAPGESDIRGAALLESGWADAVLPTSGC